MLSTDQILALRSAVDRPRPGLDPIEILHEVEAADCHGNLANVTTVLLLGSECKFRCTMCDLWKSTHIGPTPVGNLPAQIQKAIASPIRHAQQHTPQWIKLYNASNFFAPYNVPTEDLPRIASLVEDYDRVVVENHPLISSDQILEFAGRLNGKLEVAMGLETVEPTALRNLNKQLNVEDVRRATERLVNSEIDVRLFVLLRPPGLSESAGIEWCLASLEAARSWGVRHVSIIPVRGGNGAMEFLQSNGNFEPPLASSLEHVLDESLQKSAMVVAADLWDWQRLRGLCDACCQTRYQRLLQMNLNQTTAPKIPCECGRQAS
jgi:archaeosine synthase beta-subunit